MSVKKFYMLVECYISLERSWKEKFNNNIFEKNIDWNYTYSYKYSNIYTY